MRKAISACRTAITFLIVGAATAAFAASAWAGSLMSEDFSYADGGLVAVSGGNWNNHSGTGTDIQVVSGTAVGSMTQFPDDNRLLTSPRSSTDKTYACFSLVIPTPTAPLVCNYFAHFMVSSTVFRSKVFITPSGGSYTVGLSVTANASGSPLAPPAPPLGATWPTTLNYDQAYNIVISYNAVGGISEMWVDPIDESSSSITATDAGAASGALTAFGLRESNTSSAAFTWVVDDLSVGTTFDDACGAPPPQNEACCFADGGCVDLLVDDCIAQGGTPQGEGSSCSATFCPLPPQACCFADGSCQDLLEAVCIDAFGTPQGNGTSCASVICPQPLVACCFPDGSCQDLTEADCAVAGGTSQGAGSACAGFACPQPTEACCYIDGFCADLLPADCTSTGGIPQGPGTSCASTFCPPPPPVGACCLQDGSCIDGIYESDCNAAGGIFNTGLLCQEVSCTNATEHKSWGGIKGQYR